MKHKSINGTKRKGLLSLISALLALLTLSSCASTYTAKIKGGDGSGEWLPPVSGDWGDLGNGSGKGDYSDLFGDLGDFDPSHLFSKNGFDPSSLAGLAGLAGMGNLAEKMKDFSGFTQGDAYFIADFDANPSKYSGAGRFLFAKNKVFSKEEREELMKELSGEDVILASYKADEEGLPVEEYAVYPADENLSQIYISRKNPETGEEELLLYDYVATPVNGELPVLPGEQIPDLSGLEQGDRYSTRWLEWLIYEDQGRIYPMLENGALYTSRYDNNPQYTPSPWSIRTEGIIARLALSLGLDGQEFAYADETGERYVWKVFYRDDKGDFSAAESSHPWKIKQLKSGYYRMELDLFNYGLNMMLKDDGSNNSYETVFIIEDTEGRILCWYCNDVAWTDSSEAYYAQAVETGIQEDHRGQVPVIPGKEPQNPFSSEWLSWLIDEDKGNTYPKTDLEPSTGTFSPTLAPSAFLIWPYDGVTGSVYKTSRFGLALTVDHNKVDYTDGVGKKTHPRYVWTYGYREVGQENFLFAAYPQDNCTPYGYALYGDTCIYYLDLLNYGMRPALKEGGQPTSYELVFVIRDRENNSEVVGWQSTVVEWNASAQAYYEKAVELDIQDDVLNKAPVTTKEPADKQSNDWVEWLLETDGSDYPQFESIKLGSHVYKTGMSASPFYAQNKLFCLGVDSLQAQTMKMTKYWIFYREKGSSNAYWLLETTLKNKTSKTLNSEGLTEYSFDMVIRDPEMIVAEEAEYEAVFVSLDINQNVLGWGEVDFSYNASSEGFRKEVLAVQPEPVEPANKKTQAWVNWLLAEKDNGYPQLKTLTFGEKRYAPEMEPSPFYVNGEDFCMEVYVESELIPIRECMIFYKKRGELYYKVHDTLYVRNLKNSTLSDPNLRGSRFDLIVDPNGSPFVQSQASYDVVLVCCDSGGNVSAWGTGSFEYNDSSECFRKDIGTDDEPADKLSNEWVKWLQKYGKEVYPQFAALSFLPSDGAPFTRLDSRYRMNFSVSFAKNPFDMRSYRVFYRIKGETQYKVFSAPVITASDMGGVWTKKVALEIDPTAGYFTSNGQDPREYEVLLVALDQQGVVKSFGTGSFVFDKEAEELRKNAALAHGEPTDHTSIAWVEWLVSTEGVEAIYPKTSYFKPGEYRFEAGMDPSPVFIRKDLTGQALALEFVVTMADPTKVAQTLSIYHRDTDSPNYYTLSHMGIEYKELGDGRVRYRVLLYPNRYNFRLDGGKANDYELVVVCDQGWQTFTLCWNESAEAFRQKAETEKLAPSRLYAGNTAAQIYSERWAESLHSNTGKYKKISVTLPIGKRYGSLEPYSSLYIEGTAENGSLLQDAFLCLKLKCMDGYKSLDIQDHTIRLYYKEMGSKGDLKMLTVKGNAATATARKSGIVLLNLSEATPALLLPEDGDFKGYEMTVVISDGKDELVCFGEFTLPWNESSAAFCKEAKEQGLLG